MQLKPDPLGGGMNITRHSKSLVGSLLLSTSAWASVEPCPLATEKSIFGVWEAVDLAQVFRVFRLELNAEGVSTLTEGMPDGTFIPAFGSIVTSVKLDDGNAFIDLQTTHESLVGVHTIEDGKPYISTGRRVLKGVARTCGDSGGGVFTSTLTLEPESPSPRVWNLTFFRIGEHTLGESIREMEKDATELAERLNRERRPTSPSR